jgi:putative inorganic carbon (hco3(-)) transporter
MKRLFSNTSAILILMALALALFQRGGALLPALAGALLFGVLALLRPDLGLLLVPLTAPLYLMPALIAGLRADQAPPLRLPAYEVALLIVAGATAARWLWRCISATDHRPSKTKSQEPKSASDEFRDTDHISHITYSVSRYAPHVLFLLAGVLGVLMAAEPSRALREFRWLIAEPLLYYALVNSPVAGRKSQVAELRTKNQEPITDDRNKQHDDRLHTGNFSILNSQFSIPIVTAFVVGGALVGLIGLLQFTGLDLAGLLGTKQCFAASGAPCDNVVVTGGVRRATSVYGHPNNLGLYLGRIWPLAMTLTVAYAKNKGQTAKFLFFGLCALFCLGGIAVSFSRGAWLGAVAALAVLGLIVAPIKAQGIGQKTKDAFLPFTSYLLPLLVLILIAGLAFSLRGDITAGSTPPRLLLWREAIGYIQQYPLGIGLDQFGYYHDPSYERSLIDPALVGTSEQFAAHPHNLLLDIWLRLGPLGLVAFGWLLARFFRRRPRMAREGSAPLALGALAAMVAALLHGLVDNFYFVPDLALSFWLLLAVVERD